MKMNLGSLVIAFGLLAAAWTSNTFAQDDLVSQVQKGCSAEIEKYCSQVSLGEGRLLACFYAHEDKLSGQCQYTLYDASVQLERAVSALNYVAGECEADIKAHCASIEIGEGRIADCLKSKSDVVSASCLQAIAEVSE